MIVGDFSYRTIKWELLQVEAEGSSFLELMQELFLTQHVREPTRRNSILDLVLSTDPGMTDNINSGNYLAYIIIFNLVCSVKVTSGEEITYSYNKADCDGMSAYLRNKLRENHEWRCTA